VSRSLAAILCALKLSAPGFEPKAEAAPVLRALGNLNQHDPFTLIAVVELESRWDPTAVNPRSGAVGLGQVLPAGEDDAEGLLDWRVNLIRSSGLLATWREHCREKVGSALAVHWLQGYSGHDYVNKTSCGHRRERDRWRAVKVPAYVKKVLAKRRELARRCG
jgi:hypothetical protein